MIISKDLQWIEEYLIASSKLIDSLSKLKRITSIHGRPDTTHRIYGQLWKYKNGHYRMSIQVNYYSDSKKKYYSTMDILCTLSHELAHMYYWDHTPEHKILEAKLLTIFMKKLSKKGYVSEEIEMESIK